MMPNRLRAPLTHDEALGEQYSDRPQFLREIAEETGNRGLMGITRAIQIDNRKRTAEASRRRHEALAGR